MLDAIIRLSLRYRVLIVLVSLVLLVYGGYLSSQLRVDVFPDLDRPRVVLLTECPGLAAEEVEMLVSQPIETSLLGASGVQAVRSQSVTGLNVLYVEFGWDTDIRTARQTVQERLSVAAGSLPEGIRPQMAPTSSLLGQIVIAGLHPQRGPGGGDLAAVGKTGDLAELLAAENGQPRLAVWRATDRHRPQDWQSLEIQRVEWLPSANAIPANSGRKAIVVIEGKSHEVVFPSVEEQRRAMRTLADGVVRPRLLKIPGVAEVFVQGGDRQQYHVLADPAALIEYGVSLQEIEKALKENNVNSSGGFAVQGDIEKPIRLLGRLGPDADKVLEDLRKVVVRTTPQRTILLEQVARVTVGSQIKRGDGGVNGRAGVVLTIAKQPHADTRSVTDQIMKALGDTEDSLPANMVIDTDLFKLKNFIDRGIRNVGEALIIGALLVLAVLFLFLLNFRTTFITLTAIPLSLVITTVVFRLFSSLSGTHLSINVMTLGGLAVAMGELVDDAIVDVENIFRRLRQNNALASPRPTLSVVYEASREIRRAIVFGTAVVILVFLPLFAMSGVEGRLFAPLGIAYITSILASLAVSLTVTPVLSYYLLPQSRATLAQQDDFLVRGLKWGARYLIRFSMARPGWLLALTWITVGLAAWQLSRLGADFLPPFDEGSVQVNVWLPPGHTLQASLDVAAVMDRKFGEMQKTEDRPRGEILSFVRRTGRAELDEHAIPVSASEYILSINPECGRPRDAILKQLLQDLRTELPGVEIEAEQPLAHSISHMLSGVAAQIAIKVYGDHLETLRSMAEQIKAVIADVPGITPPVVEPLRQADEVHIQLRPDDLAFHGVNRAYVAEFVQTALQGEPISQVVDGPRRFDVVLRLEDGYRTDDTQLGELRMDLPDGRGQLKLGDLADILEGSGPNGINRENARRRLVIRCNAQGRDLASVVADIQRRVREQVPSQQGYFIEYGGQFESQQRAAGLIIVLAGVSLIGMFVVLMMLYPSVRIVLQILNALPTAFVGGVLALTLTGQSLTVASMVGFISLGGIAVRNGILLVTHYFHLMKEEGECFTRKMILRGSLERLAPVLMTALTAGLGLVPLVLAGRQPGREILYPVATVILGGLVTSTFCEFLIHPGLFWRFSGKDAVFLIQKDEENGYITVRDCPTQA
jgi:HME family heavy-metal exporter